jgi:hypothetical protein
MATQFQIGKTMVVIAPPSFVIGVDAQVIELTDAIQDLSLVETMAVDRPLKRSLGLVITGPTKRSRSN